MLKNVHEAVGAKVVGINYLGGTVSMYAFYPLTVDWGKQYGLLALAYNKWGNEEELDKDAIGHLTEVHPCIQLFLREI